MEPLNQTVQPPPTPPAPPTPAQIIADSGLLLAGAAASASTITDEAAKQRELVEKTLAETLEVLEKVERALTQASQEVFRLGIELVAAKSKGDEFLTSTLEKNKLHPSKAQQETPA